MQQKMERVATRGQDTREPKEKVPRKYARLFPRLSFSSSA